jgi:hypothetical protein
VTREGHSLRLIGYVDPVAGKAYEFLSNELDLPPGVLAELYRRRWDVEKVFDELKNKLGEKKAWATSSAAKQAQAHFLTITHNLLLLYDEQALAVRHEVQNQAEDLRRGKRKKEQQQIARKNGQPLSTLVARALSATQRSVKFIRWCAKPSDTNSRKPPPCSASSSSMPPYNLLTETPLGPNL